MLIGDVWDFCVGGLFWELAENDEMGEGVVCEGGDFKEEEHSRVV